MTTVPVLTHAAVGTPLTRKGISLIPVYLHGDRPPALSADTSTVTVTEAEVATVPGTLHDTALPVPVADPSTLGEVTGIPAFK